MKYFKFIKDKTPFTKHPAKPHSPILTEEDEAFLSKVADSPEKTRVDHSGDAQIALMDGAQNIPLPMSPREENDLDRELALEGSISRAVESAKDEKPAETQKKRRPWSWMMGGEAKEKKDTGKAVEVSNCLRTTANDEVDAHGSTGYRDRSRHPNKNSRKRNKTSPKCLKNSTLPL